MKWLAILAGITLPIVGAYVFTANTVDAAAVKTVVVTEAGESAGVLTPSGVDTTAAFRSDIYDGIGFCVTWTDNDSVQVALQTTLDGTNWFTYNTQWIDGGTTGPFYECRAVEVEDLLTTTKAGGFSNFPIGVQVRAILTATAMDSCQSTRFGFMFSN